MSGFDAYKVQPAEPLDAKFFDRRFRDVDNRFQAIEAVKIAWEEALRVVQDRVLSRSEQVIAGLRDQLLAITELEWLTAHSTTSRTLAESASMSFEIIEADRALFTPGPYAVLSRSASPDTWAVVRTVGYDRSTGQWDVEIVSFAGPAGPWGDWEATAVAGSTLAQMAFLDQGVAARDEAVSARDTVVPLAAEVESLHADVVAMAGDAAGAGGFDARIAALEAASWFNQ